MKKLAFFVEGLTEQLFIKSLLNEIVGKKDITITETKFSNNCELVKMLAKSTVTQKEYYVLIIDCGGDSKVQSAIIDNHPTLIKQGYHKILGLLDVHPKTYSDIPKMKKGLKYGVPTTLPTDILLSALEIEAWFLAEFSHLEKIHPSLTRATVMANFSHDLLSDDVEQILNPAKRLDEIYRSVGKRYLKKTSSLKRTVKALDYDNLYVEVQHRVPHLKVLIDHVHDFLT